MNTLSTAITKLESRKVISIWGFKDWINAYCIHRARQVGEGGESKCKHTILPILETMYSCKRWLESTKSNRLHSSPDHSIWLSYNHRSLPPLIFALFWHSLTVQRWIDSTVELIQQKLNWNWKNLMLFWSSKHQNKIVWKGAKHSRLSKKKGCSDLASNSALKWTTYDWQSAAKARWDIHLIKFNSTQIVLAKIHSISVQYHPVGVKKNVALWNN